MIVTFVGIVLAILAVAYVLQPLIGPARQQRARVPLNDLDIEAMVADYRRDRPVCHSCGLRPEPNATFCSECGRPLAPPTSALDRIETPHGDANRDQRSS